MIPKTGPIYIPRFIYPKPCLLNLSFLLIPSPNPSYTFFSPKTFGDKSAVHPLWPFAPKYFSVYS